VEGGTEFEHLAAEHREGCRKWREDAENPGIFVGKCGPLRFLSGFWFGIWVIHQYVCWFE